MYELPLLLSNVTLLGECTPLLPISLKLRGQDNSQVINLGLPLPWVIFTFIQAVSVKTRSLSSDQHSKPSKTQILSSAFQLLLNKDSNDFQFSAGFSLRAEKLLRSCSISGFQSNLNFTCRSGEKGWLLISLCPNSASEKQGCYRADEDLTHLKHAFLDSNFLLWSHNTAEVWIQENTLNHTVLVVRGELKGVWPLEWFCFS